MRVFVLTSCVAKKKYSEADIKPVLEKHGLSMPTCDLEKEEKYKEVLKDFVLPAFQMYQGTFNYVKDLVNKYREKGDQVELRIISARYGLISEETPIVPYECTFQYFRKNKIRQTAEKLRIYENLLEFLEKNEFDRSVVILGKDYLLTVFDQKRGIDFLSQMKTKQLVVFASIGLQSKVTFRKENLVFVSVSGIGDRNKKIREFINSIGSCQRTPAESFCLGEKTVDSKSTD